MEKLRFKINSNTKPKKVWQMIRNINGQNKYTPTNHLTHNNLKITDEKDIAASRNFLAKFIRPKPKQKFSDYQNKSRKS